MRPCCRACRRSTSSPATSSTASGPRPRPYFGSTIFVDLARSRRRSSTAICELSRRAIFFESRDQIGSEVEPAAAELDLLRLALAVCGASMQLVLAALVGEVGDRLAVRRPGRVALVDAGGVGQVARVALLGGDGDDLAAELDRGPRAARRDARRRGRTSPPSRTGPRLSTWSVAMPTFSRCGCDSPRGQQVQVAGLLEDELACRRCRCRGPGSRCTCVTCFTSFDAGVVGEHVVLAGAVGAEVDACRRPSSGRGRCSGPSAAGSRPRRAS